MFDQSGNSEKDTFGFGKSDLSKKKPEKQEGSSLSMLQNLPPLGQPKRNHLEAMKFDIDGLDESDNKSIDSKKSKKSKYCIYNVLDK